MTGLDQTKKMMELVSWKIVKNQITENLGFFFEEESAF